VAYNGGGIPEIVSHRDDRLAGATGDTNALAERRPASNGPDFTKYATQARTRGGEFLDDAYGRSILALFEKARLALNAGGGHRHR